jgi:hypothetical protein
MLITIVMYVGTFMTYHRVCIWSNATVPIVEQEHMKSPLVFSGVRVSHLLSFFA